MFRSFLAIISLGVLSSSVAAQSETDQVKEAIEILFNGMREGDSTAVALILNQDVRMNTSFKNREGIDIVREGSRSNFLNAVGTPHDEVWDERIWDLDIKVDGGIATAWMKYAFYLDDNFSHCGVNALQLIRTQKGWQIFNLIDTRRKQCDLPDAIKKGGS